MPLYQGFAGFLFFAKTNVRSRTNVRFCTFGDGQSRDPRRDLLRMVLKFNQKNLLLLLEREVVKRISAAAVFHASNL